MSGTTFSYRDRPMKIKSIKTVVYKFSFENILKGGKNQRFLDFPGRYGSHDGPFKDRASAWEAYVRILRESFFLSGLYLTNPEQVVVYEEQVPVFESEGTPPPYVPPTNYQI